MNFNHSNIAFVAVLALSAFLSGNPKRSANNYSNLHIENLAALSEA